METLQPSCFRSRTSAENVPVYPRPCAAGPAPSTVLQTPPSPSQGPSSVISGARQLGPSSAHSTVVSSHRFNPPLIRFQGPFSVLGYSSRKSILQNDCLLRTVAETSTPELPPEHHPPPPAASEPESPSSASLSPTHHPSIAITATTSRRTQPTALHVLISAARLAGVQTPIH
jgi:hypothetical protein